MFIWFLIFFVFSQFLIFHIYEKLLNILLYPFLKCESRCAQNYSDVFFRKNREEKKLIFHCSCLFDLIMFACEEFPFYFFFHSLFLSLDSLFYSNFQGYGLNKEEKKRRKSANLFQY